MKRCLEEEGLPEKPVEGEGLSIEETDKTKTVTSISASIRTLEAALKKAKVLEAYFHNHPRVQVNTEPTTRKYVEYGVTLLGFDHGDELKPQRLPDLMAQGQRRTLHSSRHVWWDGSPYSTFVK